MSRDSSRDVLAWRRPADSQSLCSSDTKLDTYISPAMWRVAFASGVGLCAGPFMAGFDPAPILVTPLFADQRRVGRPHPFRHDERRMGSPQGRPRADLARRVTI